MRKKIAHFSLSGLKWDCYIDNEKTRASERLYIVDRDNLEVSVCESPKGFEASKDKIIEHLIKSTVSLTLSLTWEKEISNDKFISPFASFLYQFIKSDTFDGQTGTFQLGGSVWNVVNDKTYTFHRDVNGECDFNIGRVILELYDNETMKPRKVEYVRHVYIHEVVHAILGQMGHEHEEKFVQVVGGLMYELLNTLVFIDGDKEKRAWPPKIKKAKK